MPAESTLIYKRIKHLMNAVTSNPISISDEHALSRLPVASALYIYIHGTCTPLLSIKIIRFAMHLYITIVKRSHVTNCISAL